MQGNRNKDLGWVLSTNFAEGLPYAIITSLSVVLMADMGLPNAEVAAWASLLAMPWSFKALWSPLVGRRKGHIFDQRGLKLWMWSAQVFIAACIGGVAGSLFFNHWLYVCLIALAVGAFASATYDVACDGYYMESLDKGSQSYFVGIRSTAYRLSLIFVSGLLTTLVGLLAKYNGVNLTMAWVWVLAGTALLMLVFALIHRILLPVRRTDDCLESKTQDLDHDKKFENDIWLDSFVSFLKKPDLWFILLFLLFYRLGEALLSKMSILFLKAPVLNGGLGLDNTEYGLIYGTIGVGALIIGGIWGGMLVARYGLRRCIIPLALALNLPDLLYVWLSVAQPESRLLIGALVGVEQFGYGIGFTAYMVFLLQSSQGRFSTSHYAFLTALMSIGMNIPSMISGWLQESLGYTQFFWVVVVCTIPGMIFSILLFKRCKS